MKIREDINFLRNPNWVVSQKEIVKEINIVNDFGSYEVSTTSPYGLPLRLDKTILCFLQYKLLSNNLDFPQIITTRYEVAKNVFNKHESFSQSKYQRIMIALERWKSINLFFNKSFYEKDKYIDKSFTIVDDFEINAKKKLVIRFNADYIRQLKNTEFYKILDFSEYRNLTKPISLRLYEILIKHFTEQAVFYIDIRILAENITLQRKSYESQILASIKPAVAEINQNTNLAIEFWYEKNLSLCIFKNMGINKKNI